jgi:mutator protein MutT
MKFRVIVVGVIEKEDQILIGQKASNVGPYPNTWHIPGGGVDLDTETLEEALRREIREETGIEISNIQPVGFDEDHEPDKHGELTHYVFLSFTATYESGDASANDDLRKLQWVSKKELQKINFNKPSKKLLKKLSFID